MDIIRDKNLAQLYQMLRASPYASEFVKTADVYDQDEWACLPDSAFADPTNRTHPIVDAKHTAISLMYATKFGASKEVDTALRKAAELFEIDAERFSVLEKQASVATEPLCYLVPQNSKFPVYGEMSVKLACDYLVNYRGSMDRGMRDEYSENLVKVAEQLHVALPTEVLRIAGRTVTNTKLASDYMYARKFYANTPAANNAYAKLAEFMRSVPEELSDVMAQRKLVELIYDVDKLAGLDARYSVKVPPPESVVYNTNKVAELRFSMGPYTITQSKLARVDADILGDIIGQDMLSDLATKEGSIDFQEAMSLLPTLPRDIQDTVARTFRL